MTASVNCLSSKGVSSSVLPNIRETHLYVKFKPLNDEQYELLKTDTNLILYDYPLDYEIVQNGNRYHDSTLPTQIPTYQYGVVKTGFSFNNSVSYEILESLYIPEEDHVLCGINNNNIEYVDKLLDQAYIQTGNFADTIKYVVNNETKSFHPGGNILINDTRLTQYHQKETNIGLEGLVVRARRWFTIYYAQTDFNGDFRMTGSFNRPCNYSFYFDQRYFTVKEHYFGLTAWINGPKITGDWNYTISNGYDRFVGHIFRAAYRYHFGEITNLLRPIRGGGKRTIYLGKDCSGNHQGTNWIVFPIIKVWRYHDDSNVEYDSDEIYSTTIHETAHTTHVMVMNCGPIQYLQVSSQIMESWPIGVEWWITKLEYKNTRGIPNYSDWNYSENVNYPARYSFQYWTSVYYDHDYSNLFINLWDNYNDTWSWSQTGVANDNVAGYTFANIEKDILKHSYGLVSLKEKLKEFKPNGVTEAQIDQLLNFY